MHGCDEAGAETVGALVLFGLFVTVVAVLNVTAVPSAGLAAEDAHHARVLDALAGLQGEAEAGSKPGSVGATASRALPLGPERAAAGGFLGFFVAKPVQATGQITFEPGYGNLTLSHTRHGESAILYDLGSPTARFPLGRIVFDPHAQFREAGALSLENGALVAATPGGGATLRHAPPVSVTTSGGVTHVSVMARVLNGTSADAGGTSLVRLGLATEAATLSSPVAPNADRVVLRMETHHGAAWADHFHTISQAAGLADGAHYSVLVVHDAAEGGLDVVSWAVQGSGAGNDVRLTHGFAAHGVRIG